MGKAAWEELIDPVEQTGIVRFRHHQYSLSGIGGVETGGDAAEFILPGANTVQVGKNNSFEFCRYPCSW